jgi:uncharacterized protein YcnI
VSLPRPLTRAALIGAVVGGLLAAGVGIASAHVTVSSPNATAGGFGTVVFSVPDESDTASTVRVRIQVPEKTPLASLSIQPVPGWTATTTTTQLATPLEDDDGNPITSAISVIDFTAAAGAGIAPGQFQEFSLSGGPFPDAASMVFNVVQTYSDGTEAAWIEPTVQGQPEPQHPAPVLTLSASSAAAPASSDEHAGHTTATDSSSAPVSLALFFAILALVVALAGVVLAWRALRRTVVS